MLILKSEFFSDSCSEVISDPAFLENFAVLLPLMPSPNFPNEEIKTVFFKYLNRIGISDKFSFQRCTPTMYTSIVPPFSDGEGRSASPPLPPSSILQKCVQHKTQKPLLKRQPTV